MVVSQEPVSCRELIERFPLLLTDSVGDIERKFTAVSAPNTQDESAAVFLSSPRAVAQASETKARVLVLHRKMRTDAEKRLSDGRTLLFSPNPELAMALTIDAFFLSTPYTNRGVSGVHPTASVSPDSVLAQGVRVGPNAFIGAHVRLGPNVFIGANAVIEDDTEIEDGTVIHPLAYIGHSTKIGKRCEVHPNAAVGKEGFGYAHDEKGNHYRIPHQGRVVLEDDVHIGACCTIDRATMTETRIRAGTKFDNRVHIAHNNDIGRNSLVTAGFTMAGSSKIGANFITGGQSTVTGHIEICDNVNLAANSVVGKGIDLPGQYGGSPLLPLQKYIKMRASFAHVYEMRKQISRIMEKLRMEKES